MVCESIAPQRHVRRLREQVEWDAVQLWSLRRTDDVQLPRDSPLHFGKEDDPVPSMISKQCRLTHRASSWPFALLVVAEHLD